MPTKAAYDSSNVNTCQLMVTSVALNVRKLTDPAPSVLTLRPRRIAPPTIGPKFLMNTQSEMYRPRFEGSGYPITTYVEIGKNAAARDEIEIKDVLRPQWQRTGQSQCRPKHSQGSRTTRCRSSSSRIKLNVTDQFTTNSDTETIAYRQHKSHRKTPRVKETTEGQIG